MKYENWLHVNTQRNWNSIQSITTVFSPDLDLDLDQKRIEVASVVLTDFKA